MTVMPLLWMSLTGSILIIIIAALRTILDYRLSHKLILSFWTVAIIRLLLPFSFTDILTLIGQNEVFPLLTQTEDNISTIVADSTTIIEDNFSYLDFPFTIIWIIGIVILAGYFAYSYIRSVREFRTALPIEDQYIKNWILEHSQRRKIEVRTLDSITTPLTYGIIHPIILIPKDLDLNDKDQLEYILYHEYTHIKNFDVVHKLFIVLVLCIHWFNPIVWILYELANRDIEIVCDSNVIKNFNRCRSDYARTLIKLEEDRHRSAPLYSSFAKNAIEERIRHIMKPTKKTLWTLAIALILITFGATTAFAASSHSIHSKHNYSHKITTNHQIDSTGSSSHNVNCTDPSCTDPEHNHQVDNHTTNYSNNHDSHSSTTTTTHHTENKSHSKHR